MWGGIDAKFLDDSGGARGAGTDDRHRGGGGSFRRKGDEEVARCDARICRGRLVGGDMFIP